MLILDDPFDDDGMSEVDTNQDNEPDDGLTDVHDKVYANVPEETHMLAPVANCEFCHAGTSLNHLDFAAVVVKSISPLLTRLWNWLGCGLALMLMLDTFDPMYSSSMVISPSHLLLSFRPWNHQYEE